MLLQTATVYGFLVNVHISILPPWHPWLLRALIQAVQAAMQEGIPAAIARTPRRNFETWAAVVYFVSSCRLG